jgi:hypothetical protein
LGKLLVLLANIRLDWKVYFVNYGYKKFYNTGQGRKCLAGTGSYALAYLASLWLTKKKVFIGLSPDERLTTLLGQHVPGLGSGEEICGRFHKYFTRGTYDRKK